MDGVKIYASGDTSKTKQMKSFAKMNLDYAILCGDGAYNMNPEEAAECTEIIGAKKNIIIHLTPGQLFDYTKAEAWQAPNKLVISDGNEIFLMRHLPADSGLKSTGDSIFACGLTAEEITYSFNKAVQESVADKKQKGLPIAKYDNIEKRAYLEFADGSREYVN